MSLLDIVNKPSRRIKIEVEMKKFKKDTKPFDHSRGRPFIPFDKGFHIVDPPTIKRTSEVKQKDFGVWFRTFLSRNPHFEYICTHSSSWCSKTVYILFDTRRKVKVAMSRQEVEESIKYSSELRRTT